MFYKPLGITGWSVAMVCPESDIFGGYMRLYKIVIFIVIVGLILMRLAFSRIIKREPEAAEHAGTVYRDDCIGTVRQNAATR